MRARRLPRLNWVWNTVSSVSLKSCNSFRYFVLYFHWFSFLLCVCSHNCFCKVNCSITIALQSYEVNYKSKWHLATIICWTVRRWVYGLLSDHIPSFPLAKWNYEFTCPANIISSGQSVLFHMVNQYPP